jgi:hypothetical protein
MTWYQRSLSDRDTHRGHLRRGRVLAACDVEFSSLRRGGKVAQLCLANRPILIRFVRSIIGPVCPVNRHRLSSRPGWTGQKAVTDDDRQLLLDLGRFGAPGESNLGGLKSNNG